MIERLILGTVQLGQDYGINNPGGRPNTETAFDILNLAWKNGLRKLDTAEAYGESQKVIGAYHKKHPSQNFKVYSKRHPNAQVGLKTGIIKTLNTLHLEKLSGYFMHRLSDYQNLLKSGEIKENDLLSFTGKLGVSVYNNEEAATVAVDENLSLIQLPFNVLDNRKLRQPAFDSLISNGVEIHSRSAFLQGLLFMKVAQIPVKVQGLSSAVEGIQQIAADLGCPVGQLALAYALKFGGDGIVLGVERVQQLEEILTWAQSGDTIPEAAWNRIESLKIDDKKLLNPANWS